MPIINYRTREVNCKVVYVGPSLGGKTTNISALHSMIPAESRTALQSVDTEGDRTLFFDYFSVDLPEVAGFRTKILVYGVPGQPYYRSTRKLVLNGVDGLVFVADSDRSRLEANREALEDVHGMLRDYGYDASSIPLVFLYNKRDLFFLSSTEELGRALNNGGCPSFEAVAIQNRGVRETFEATCRLVLDRLKSTLEPRQGAGRRMTHP